MALGQLQLWMSALVYRAKPALFERGLYLTLHQISGKSLTILFKNSC